MIAHVKEIKKKKKSIGCCKDEINSGEKKSDDCIV